MKTHKLQILAVFALLLLVPSIALAFSVQNGNAVYVAKDQTIDGNLYAAGMNITIDGRVTGDVICAGQSVIINGTIDGDVICAEQSLIVAGKVGGSVRTAGNDINIRGNVERSLNAFGANVNIENGARIGWDALTAAATVIVRGEIGRSLLGAGASYILDGKIGNDAVLYLDGNVKSEKRGVSYSDSDKKKWSELTVGDSAAIGGGLTYTSRSEAQISEKAQVKGEVEHKTSPVKKSRKAGAGGFASLFIVATLSALVVGSVLISIWKPAIIEMSENMAAKFWPSVGWGIVFTFITPIIAILFALTIIGFRLTLVTMWSWLILLMLSKIVAGIAIGRLLLSRFWASRKDSLVTAMIAGVTLSWFIFYIPVIGWLISVVAVWWGMGGLLLHLKKHYDMNKPVQQ